jgi:hypothetical protein
MATPALLLREDMAGLSDEASADLARLWRSLDTSAQAAEMLRDTLPDLVAAYGSMAATIAADWYDDLREMREAPKRFTAIPADIAETGTQALVGWALAEATSDDAFKTLILGGVQRRIVNFGRLTVTTSSVADPGAVGWKRTGLGRCDFCRMLIGRGAVYTEATADFEAHDHCQCGAEPDF